ncbi:PIN domain-containing protein [archaeon]|nr:PIN domain-containing protein [archaeon]
MTDIKFIDSSVWLSYYFAQNEEAKNIIEGERLVLTSSLCLFEIKKRLLSLKKDFATLLDFIKKRSAICLPSVPIVERAAELAKEYNLGAMDALIYSSAILSDAELITGDNDFRNLSRVKII